MVDKSVTIYLASDHAGFGHKQILREHLQAKGWQVQDMGAAVYDADDDYPEFIMRAAQEVSKAPTTAKAIIMGGSGQGEAILANRFVGVRAAVYYGGPEDILHLSREHNNANVLSLGARFVAEEEVTRLVDYWLDKAYPGQPRYERRIKQVEKISKGMKRRWWLW